MIKKKSNLNMRQITLCMGLTGNMTKLIIRRYNIKVSLGLKKHWKEKIIFLKAKNKRSNIKIKKS